MNKQTVALIVLLAGWTITADIANATTYEEIAEQWCGDVTDYVFAPNTLTVKFHDNRPANVFKITKYNYANNSVRINWINGVGKESDTVFAEFSGSKMAQQAATNRAELCIAAETHHTLEKLLSGVKRTSISTLCYE
jgi:hypothetical protein